MQRLERIERSVVRLLVAGLLVSVLVGAMAFPARAYLQVLAPHAKCLEDVTAPVLVPVHLLNNGVNPIDAMGVDVTFDPNVLNYVGVQRGSLTIDWDVFDAALIAPGVVRVGGFNTEPIAIGQSGSIVVLEFLADCCANAGKQSRVCLANLADDLAFHSIQCGSVTCGEYSPGRVQPASPVRDCATASDDTVYVDVDVWNIPRTVRAAGIEVTFDDTHLQFVDALRGAFVSGWSQFAATLVPGYTNRIRIGGFDPGGTPPEANAPFARLRFVTACCGTGVNASLIHVVDITDDLVGAQKGYGIFTCKSFPPGLFAVDSADFQCGERVKIDIRIGEVTMPIDAFGFDVTYDPSRMGFRGFETGDLTAGWADVQAVLVVDVIRVTASNATAIPSGSGGVLVTLEFSAYGVTEAANLCVTNPVGDATAYDLGCGFFRCSFVKTKQATWGGVKALYR
jgi:hypothetical protein